MSPRPPLSPVVKLALIAGILAFALGLGALLMHAAPNASAVLDPVRAETTPPPLAARIS